MNGDTLFLVAGAVAFVAALIYTGRGRAVVAAATSAPTAADAEFGGSFEHLDALAKRQAYKQLGEQYVASRARRMAAEIQEDLPASPKGGS